HGGPALAVRRLKALTSLAQQRSGLLLARKLQLQPAPAQRGCGRVLKLPVRAVMIARELIIAARLRDLLALMRERAEREQHDALIERRAQGAMILQRAHIGAVRLLKAPQPVPRGAQVAATDRG